MIRLDNYSYICGKFISKNKLIKNSIVHSNNTVIDRIYQNILLTNPKNDIKYEKKIKIQKTHSKDPLVYDLYRKEFNDFSKFKEWYDQNHNQLRPLLQHQLSEEVKLKIGYDNRDKYAFNNLLYNNIFISLDIQMVIEQHDIVLKEYKHNDVFINLFQLNDDDKFAINNIIHILDFMARLSGKKKKLQLNIILTDSKKKLYGKGEPITPTYTNSGCADTKTINLWRAEELEKVLIHELIHFYEIDFCREGDSRLDDYFLKFNVVGIKPYEAYTETLAIIIHSVYLCSKFSLKKEQFKNILLYEVNFSLFQCRKILDHFDINNKNELCKIKQTTDIFSYFFLKTNFLLNLDSFLNFINDTIYFDHRYSDFLKLVKSIDWDKFINLSKRYQSVKISDEYLVNNLRMSCLSNRMTV